MITCSKCNTNFHIELNRITKDSTIPCIKCGNECFVKLLDLQHHSVDEEYSAVNGFKSLSDIEHVGIEDDEKDNSFSPTKHLVIILLIAKLLLTLFILGIIKITHVDEKFPMIGRFYNAINIIPRKTTRVTGFTSVIEDRSLHLKISVENTADKSDLVSDIKVVLFDVFKGELMEHEEKPHLIISGNKVKDIEISIPLAMKQVRYLSLYMNGRLQVDQSPVDVPNAASEELGEMPAVEISSADIGTQVEHDSVEGKEMFNEQVLDEKSPAQ